MTWKQIFELIGAVFASIGGAGAIIFALSSFFGKMWANKLLEKQKAEYQKDIEDYKSALSRELENVKASNEKLTYITKVQYDIEISAIRDLNCKAHKLAVICFTVVPSEIKELKNSTSMFQRYNEYFNSYSNHIDKLLDSIGNSFAFVENYVLERYSKFLRLCREQFEFFDKVYKPSCCLSDENINKLCEKGEEISKVFNIAIKTTRRYLKRLKVID